jgi:hypothetical protein
MILLAAGRGFADETAVPASDPAASAPVDKSQFDLFNPVPTNLLRDMVTDRPTRGTTPVTVDAGHVQFEIGAFDYTFDRDRDQPANSRSDDFLFGQVNARVGVTNNVEFTVQIDPFDCARNTDFTAGITERQQGVGDTFLGGKINLFGNDTINNPWAVSMGLIPQVKLPSARRDIGNGHAEATLGIPVFVNLPGGFHLLAQTTPGWERNDTNTGDRLGWQNSVEFDRNVIDNLDLYVEYWSHVSTASHQIAEQSIDVGLVYTVNSNLQVDSGLFLGLNRATPSFEWTAGFSVRF